MSTPTASSERAKHQPARIVPLVLELKAAAEAIGVSEWVMRKFVADKLLPTVRYPSMRNEGEHHARVLIAVEDLRVFVARHREKLESPSKEAR